MAQREPASVAIAKMLDQSGYLQDLREERSEEAEGRIENLAELVSAAREYEGREPEPSLAGFVDRLSLLSEADESEGAEDARVLLMTHARGQGPRVPRRDHRRPRRGPVPALALVRRRRPARGGAAAVATSG